MKFINKQIELLTFLLEFVRLIQSDLVLSDSSGQVLELTHPGIAALIKRNRENIGHIWTPGNHKPSQSYVNILASKKVDKGIAREHFPSIKTKHRSGPRNSNSSFKAGSRSFSASRFACKNVDNVVNEVKIYIVRQKKNDQFTQQSVPCPVQIQDTWMKNHTVSHSQLKKAGLLCLLQMFNIMQRPKMRLLQRIWIR